MRCASVCSALEPTHEKLAHIRAGLNRQGRDSCWEQSCQEFLDAWEPLIRWLARHYAPASSVVLDFAQIARMTLIRAALKFPAGYPGRFEHYARRAVRNALLDEAQRFQAQQRELHLDGDRPSPEETSLSQVIRLEERALVRQRVAGWVERLRTLVDMLFVQDLSQADAARALGVTPARVSQLCRDLRRQGETQFEDLVDRVG